MAKKPSRRELEAKLQAQREAMAAKRGAMRSELQSRVEAQRGRMQARLEASRRTLQRRKKKKSEERRRWPYVVLAVLLLLLLLFFVRDCRCNESPPGEEEEAVAEGSAPEVVPTTPEPAPLTGRVEPVERPSFSSPPPAPVPWIDTFRMQVAARSPRLAACFVGASQPGTLKWTTSVEASSGRVSDHDLQPMLGGASLTAAQRDCVLAVLADPPYRLPAADLAIEEPVTPARVGLVIEF